MMESKAELRHDLFKEKVYCERCGREIPEDEGFVSDDGTCLCEFCGDELLTIHDYTQYDDYPYIVEDAGDWDGSQFCGPVYKRRDSDD